MFIHEIDQLINQKQNIQLQTKRGAEKTAGMMT